jgi:hypothetical protein
VIAKNGTNAMLRSPHLRSISSLTHPKSTPYLFCTHTTTPACVFQRGGLIET